METNLAVIGQKLTREINPLVEKARALTVTTVSEKEVAVVEMNLISELIKVVKADFEGPKGKAHETWKAIVAQEKGHLDPLETAKDTIRGKIGTFDLEMKRQAEKEAERLREEARKAFDKQLADAQEKIDAILAKTQDVDETIELLNMELKRDDLTEIERQKLEAQLEISYAIKDNNQERVEEIHAQAAEPVFIAPAPSLVVTDTKVKGSSSRFELVPTVVNKMALIKAVANGSVPETVLDVNMGQLKRFVNMWKKPVTGVSFTEQAVVSGRAR